MMTILLFLVILSLLVFVHEAGHFFAARRAGARVEEFGFGFPPRIVGIRRGETIYSINWIPLGGFVRIHGESGEDAQSPHSFAALPAWRRLLILLSGVGMNVVLAMVLLAIAYGVGAPTALDATLPKHAVVVERNVQIVNVAEGTPAATAGLRLGDVVVRIDGEEIDSVEEAQQYNASRAGVSERVVIRRGKIELTVTLTPTVLPESEGRAVWGVGLVEAGIVRFPWYQALWLGIRNAVLLLWQIIVAFVETLRALVVEQRVSADIAGPVGIAAMTGRIATLGFVYLIQFTALLSLNLALINALPLPALDGGRAFFVVLEKVRRRPVSPRLETLIHNIGFAVLMLLILVVTIRDVSRYGGKFLLYISQLVQRVGG